jgi:vancomycin resistance protein YoaR
LLLAVLGVGFAFAGSSDRIADGVTIGGVDVGGMTEAEALRTLEQRAAVVAAQPALFTYKDKTFSIRPEQLGMSTDWEAAIEQALDRGDGFALFRGFSRIKLRFSGADIEPVASADEAKVAQQVQLLAGKIDQTPREAAIVLEGLSPVVEPAQVGIELDQDAASTMLLHSLARLERGEAVALPVGTTEPKVTQADLEPLAAQVRTALSGPVRLEGGKRAFSVKPRQLASFLVLPSDGTAKLSLGGPAVERYFKRVAGFVNRDPRDADFRLVGGGKVRVVPALDGQKLNVGASRKALLSAALGATGSRSTELVIETAQPKLSTEDAKKMGIVGTVSSYTTLFGGIANRIHNVQLVASLLDDHLIAPGETFSFNDTTGERNAAKGFLEAPVIINGELETGLGGGVCQVSTTVFNAAYEAGLPIKERTNHALYISHYPLGRDATVNYPDTDLKFTNDSGHWLWLRTFVDGGSLTVNLYGTPLHRKVVSETAPLTVTGQPKVKRILDPDLYKGQKVVEEAGQPSRATSVRRIVYDENGNVLYDATWYSSYRSEPKVIRVGTKPKPKTDNKPDAGSQAGAGQSGGGTGSGSGSPAPSEPAPSEPTPTDPGTGGGTPPPPPA